MRLDTDMVPAPDDLVGWKAVERFLGKKIKDRIDSSGLITPALFRRYFGCKKSEYLLEEYEKMSVIHAFIEWLVNDYRPALYRNKKKSRDKERLRHRSIRKGKTLAEKMLAAELPAAEAAFLEATSQSHPSLFRITRVESGSTVAVEDVLLGGGYVIQDKMLSECVETDQCLTGRVFPVGQFHFFSPAGPPLPNHLIMEAADYLESEGVTFSPEGLRRKAEMFGLLWNWYDKQIGEKRMPFLRNTDGEDLVWQTASFSVSDENVVREALVQREDIEYDQEEDEYLWIRHHGKRSVIPGEMLSLGHMRFVLNELILEVNSAERLSVAKKWLGEISGVTFLDVKSQDYNQGDFDVPMDDKMGSSESVEITPDLAASLQEHFTKHYMGWLDSPLPALEGKTPRQMCRSNAGQQKVAMLIRSISSPVGNPGVKIEVPYQEMFKELGIESE